MSIKKDIVKGVRLFWLLLALVALCIVGRIIQLQMTDVSKIGAKAVAVSVKRKLIEPRRGDIYAKNGYLLSCSLTHFELRVDLGSSAMLDSVFNAGVDSLALGLASIFKDKSAKKYRAELKKARKKRARYYRLGNRKINYLESEKVKKLPIFRMGKYKGGLILEKDFLRHKPFGMLGARTLGRLYTNTRNRRVGFVGLEGAYESELKGIEGEREIVRSPGRYIEFIVKEAVKGSDVLTTLDVDIQDIVQSSLLDNLKHFKAHHGTAIVLEVSTGEVKAIANLELGSDGKYYERRNYAIADAVEIGSVFKLPSMIALLEDGAVKLTDSVDTGNGRKRFYNAIMRDYKACGKISVQEVFEKSSNVGMSILVNRAYKNNPQKYINRLYDLHLGEPLGMKIKGEGRPYIKEPSSKFWSGISLPWICVGYETKITPLQMLTLYNAVANNGKMLKPRLVYAIMRNGKVIRDFSKPVVIDNNICSKSTLRKLHSLLEGVIKRGTGIKLRDSRYRIAGKTSTAHISQHKIGYDVHNYRSGFIGYFPADKPKYSCAVFIERPDKKIGHFGVSVAGPVFKKIADNLYARGMLFNPISTDSVINKNQNRIKFLKGIAGVPNIDIALNTKQKMKLVSEGKNNVMPNVKGMALNDAVFLLESKGVKVKIKGNGVINKQSIPPGTRIKKKEQVILSLL